MKKFLTTAAALSFALVACSEDSSSNAVAPVVNGGDYSSSVEESSGSENLSSAMAPMSSVASESSSSAISSAAIESSSSAMSSAVVESSSSAFFTVENQVRNFSAKCMYNDDVTENNSSEIVDGPGGTQPVSTISAVAKDGFVTLTLDLGYMTCGSTYENVKVSVEGDTLVVVGDFIDSYVNCVCPTVVSLEVKYDPAFEAANYTKFDNNIVLPLHAIEPPIAQELEPSYRMVTKAFDAKCKNHFEKTLEEPVDFTDDGLVAQIDTAWNPGIASRETPVAWYIDDDGRITVTIDEVDMVCGTVFTGFEVVARGDTLYVNPKIDPESPLQKCLCPTRISVEVAQHPNVGPLNYLMFNGSLLFALKDAMLDGN